MSFFICARKEEELVLLTKLRAYELQERRIWIQLKPTLNLALRLRMQGITTIGAQILEDLGS